jgi:hypothetical protein
MVAPRSVGWRSQHFVINFCGNTGAENRTGPQRTCLAAGQRDREGSYLAKDVNLV